MSDLFILNLECGETGLQLLTPLEQLAFQRLLCTHYSHLKGQNTAAASGAVNRDKHCGAPTKASTQGVDPWRTSRLIRTTSAVELYRVSHVRLEVKASRGAEDVVVGLHQFLFVPVGLQTLRSSLQRLKTGVFRHLYVLLCR